MSSSAERMRRLRDLRRRGAMLLMIEVDQVCLVELLVALGDLSAKDVEDPAAIRAAAECWINRATSAEVYENSVTASRRAILLGATNRP